MHNIISVKVNALWFSSNIADFGQNKSEGKPRFNFDNKKLPESSKIRTFVLDLHDVIKVTSSSYFKNLQILVNILKLYNS